MRPNLDLIVHFFDSRGHSMISNDHLVAEIDRLKAEVARLTRLLEAHVRRARVETEAEKDKPNH